MKCLFLDVVDILSFKDKTKFSENIYDYASMVNLNKIVCYSNVEIVLADDKRVDSDFIRVFFSNLLIYDLNNYYYGPLPGNLSVSKYLCIKTFIKKHKVSRFVILNRDTQCGDKDLEDNFIRIANARINEDIVERCLAKLTPKINK
jgi:hypothetical protein